MFKEKNLLIIGGSGFFGKSILDYLNRKNFQSKIYILSRNVDVIKSNEFENLHINKISTDIVEFNRLPDISEIIYAATPSDKAEYQKKGRNIIENVNLGIKNFSNLLKNEKFDGKLLYISSGAIYGPQSDEKNISEDSEIINYSNFSFDKQIYAESKEYSENIIKNLGVKGFKVSIARCFAFIGKYLPQNSHFIIGNIINSIVNKKEFELLAKNKVFRSFMHTDDLSEWLFEILNVSNNTCPIFNVGSDEFFELRDLVKIFNNKYNLSYSIKYPEAFGNTDWYVPSIEKISNKLGCKIKFNLETSINKIFNL